MVPWASSDLRGTVPSSTSVILALSQFWPCLRGNERHQELPYLPRDTVKMAGPRRVWINMCFSESYVQFALCHLNCSYYYFKWIHLSMWSFSITSTHYQYIAVLPKDTPFTCSFAEICFNVLNLTLGSKQICLKQLKSITSQTAPP